MSVETTITDVSFIDLQTDTKWEKKYSEEDQKQIYELISKCRKLCDEQRFDGSCCGPTCNSYFTRTNNWKNFAKDFFLPRFVKGVLKTKEVAAIVLGIVFVIPCDLLTLPIRLILLIFRINSNKRAIDNHPLHQYLVTQKAPDALLKTDGVAMVISESIFHKASIWGPSETVNRDTIHYFDFYRRRSRSHLSDVTLRDLAAKLR